MTNNNIKILETFTKDDFPDLDIAVLGALEKFMQVDLPSVDTGAYVRPLVVGSGNAEVAGKIMFERTDAIFASESTYEEKLRSIKEIDGVVIVSASGEKHAPIIAQYAKQFGKNITLITSTENSSASEFVDSVHVYPKNREPYTYNTSTYMAMILGVTGEDVKEIHDFIVNVVDKVSLSDFSDIDKYYLIVPARFAGIIRMLQVKFIELFGRTVARDIETVEYVAHATTVVPADGELFINFGTDAEYNNTWGKEENRLHIPLPENADYAMMMSISYYIIGKIQKARPQVFKENIEEYMKKASEEFGHELSSIVE